MQVIPVVTDMFTGKTEPATSIRRHICKGAPAVPGSGPLDKTCVECAFLMKHLRRPGKKCSLVIWEESSRTDIQNPKQRACRFFEEAQ